MKIACVIPAWNEAKNIAKVIADVRPYVQETIVVDDCSSDDTAALAGAAGAVVLRHPINRGQGAALQTGNDYALAQGAEIIVHFDGDDQFRATEIPAMTAPIADDRADIVFGSRFLGRQTNFPPLKRYLIMPLAKLFNRVFLGIQLSDPQCGFRAFNRRAATATKIMNREWAHNSEIQSNAFRAGLRIMELPVTVVYHRFGLPLSAGFQVIKDLLIHKIIK
ncbi:MAG: glycosyltransferase family 2 protein [Patescibacteria group bacterium]